MRKRKSNKDIKINPPKQVKSSSTKKPSTRTTRLPKVVPPKDTKPQVVKETFQPILGFPVVLTHNDNGVPKKCFFKDEIDLEKYLKRYKLKVGDYQVQIIDED